MNNKLENKLEELKSSLEEAIEYTTDNLDRSSFTTDADYQRAVGYSTALTDILAVLQGEATFKEILDMEGE